MDLRNFFAELRRRNVYRAAVGYAAAAWLLIQIATQALPFFETSAWVVSLIIVVLLAGFPFAMIWAWVFEWTPRGIVRTDEVPSHQSVSRKTGRKLDFIIISVFALGIAVLLFDRVRQSRVRRDFGVPEKSIAVLPFQNMSDDKQNAFFADGVQEEILTTLAKVADLKVISRTSVMQFRDADKRNLLNIATQLAVAHVLERNVQRVANRVRVTAQLVNARTDSHVWADQFDGEVADVFAIQSEIAQKIASALKAALSPKEQAALDAKPTLDLAAYDLYLRAAEAVNARPQDAKAVMVLALIDAALGRKDEPAREGERAIELLPVTSDAVDGATLVGRLSTVYAEIGDTDRSVEHLEKAAVLPHSLHYGDLKLDERFDSIRKDGRFEKILASLAPK